MRHWLIFLIASGSLGCEAALGLEETPLAILDGGSCPEPANHEDDGAGGSTKDALDAGLSELSERQGFDSMEVASNTSNEGGNGEHLSSDFPDVSIASEPCSDQSDAGDLDISVVGPVEAPDGEMFEAAVNLADDGRSMDVEVTDQGSQLDGSQSSDGAVNPNDAMIADADSEHVVDGDANHAAEGSSTPPPWSPLDLRALSLWLDAREGIQTSRDGRITTWLDRSPNRLQARQPEFATQPVYVAMGIGVHPGVSFDGRGALLEIEDTAALRFGIEDFVMEFVLRHRTPVDNPYCSWGMGTVFSKQDVNVWPYAGPVLHCNSYIASDVVPQVFAQLAWSEFRSWTRTPGIEYNDDIPRVIGMYRHNYALSLRINGRAMGGIEIPNPDGTPLNVDAFGHSAYIGARPDASQCLQGVIAEAVIAKGATTEDVANLESYLMTKYAAALGITQ